MITLKDSETGQVRICEDVICTISNTSAAEVEGVVICENGFASGIAEFLGKKGSSKGVKVEIVDDNIQITINLSVKFGYKIPEVMFEVQKKIKSSVETMTGLCVTQININVANIIFEKPAKEKSNPKS